MLGTPCLRLSWGRALPLPQTPLEVGRRLRFFLGGFIAIPPYPLASVFHGIVLFRCLFCLLVVVVSVCALVLVSPRVS